MAAGLPHVPAAALWLDERHLCPLGRLGGRARRGAACVGRQPGQGPGELVGRRTRQGTSRSGPVYAQALRVRAPDGGETRRGRRLTVKRTEPTRHGAPTLPIRRNVPPHRAAAAPLARGYGPRWRSETAGCASTPTLSGALKTWGYPQAAFFAFCLAWLADNAGSRSKAARRRAHGRQQGKDAVSSDSRALERSRTSDGRRMALPAPPGVRFRARSPPEGAHGWRELAASVQLASYQQQPRSPKKAPPERTADQKGKHVSTAKLLAQRYPC